MRKRLLSALLTVCMLLTMLPVTAFAADNSRELITFSYEDDGPSANKTVSVKVYVDSESTARDTFSVQGVNTTANHMTVKVNDGINYEIDRIEFDGGGTPALPEMSSDLKSYSFQHTWGDVTDNAKPLELSVYLRTPLPKPSAPNGFYEGSGDVVFNLYQDQLLKMLYVVTGNADIDPDGIEDVALHFTKNVGSAMLDSYDFYWADPSADYLGHYHITGRTYNTYGDVIPNNIQSITLTYEGTAVTIPADKLSCVLTSSDSRGVYEVNANDTSCCAVAFYEQGDSGLGNAGVFHLHDIVFVTPGGTVTEMPMDPQYITHHFAGWSTEKSGGDPFNESYVVNSDMRVWAQKYTSDYSSSLIYVDNTNDAFLDRFVELCNATHGTTITVDQIKDSVKIQVNGINEEHTNPNYSTSNSQKTGWDNENYAEYTAYKIYNYDADPEGTDPNASHYNKHIPFDEIQSITIFADVTLNGATVTVSFDIDKGSEPGEFGAVVSGYEGGTGSIDGVFWLKMNQGEPDDEPVNPPEPTTPAITGITKDLVESADEAKAAGIDLNVDPINFPDKNGIVVIPASEGQQIKFANLLYKITVTGKEGAKFTVTDPGAKLVSPKDDTITEQKDPIDNNNTFSGTIPEGGQAVFYVSKMFSAELLESDADSSTGTVLKNTATVETDDAGGVDEDSDEATEKVDAEEAQTIYTYIQFIGTGVDGALTDADKEYIEATYGKAVDQWGYLAIGNFDAPLPDPTEEPYAPTGDQGTGGDDFKDNFLKQIKPYITDDYNFEWVAGLNRDKFDLANGVDWIKLSVANGATSIDNSVTGFCWHLDGQIKLYDSDISVEKKLTKVVRNNVEQTVSDNMTLEVGDQLTWTITVTNEGNKEATGLKLTDTLVAVAEDGTTTERTANVTAVTDGASVDSFTVAAATDAGPGKVEFTATYTVTVDDKGLTLKNTATVTNGENDEEGKGETENPVGGVYTLTYDANGGSGAPTDNSKYNTGAKVTLATEPIPTHAPASPSAGAEEVDVLFIGWMETGDSGKIYSRSDDTAPKTITEVTFADQNITVYAAWGYDEDGNGIPDVVEKDHIVITPADITIYSGGTGYSGVVTKVEGENVSTDTANASGFPEPGYYITLPNDLDTALKQALGHNDGSPVDLSQYLTFSYNHEGVKREWKLERYDNSDGAASMANGKYIYRLVTTEGDQPVRLSITDENGNIKSGDEFNPAIGSLYQTFQMGIYAGDLDQNLITATVDIPNATDETTTDIEIGSGTLTVRGTTSDAKQGALDGSDNGTVITAEAADDTTFTINGSDLQVRDENEVQLLVDELVADTATTTTQNDLKNKAATEIKGIDATHNFDFQYIDLVDSDNGNAWVKTDKDLTLTWEYPAGMTKDNADFAIVHYKGLDRDYTNAAAEIASTNVEAFEVEHTKNGLRFSAGASGFSPVALVYSNATGDAALDTYKITYDPNGGSGSARTFEYADASSITAKDNMFTRSNYTFTGWNTAADGSGDAYEAGNVIPATGDMTLYAQWDYNGSTSSGTTRYTLTYESNGGTEFDSERYTRNTVVELDKTPIREGYTFTGWYADKDLEERITEIKMTSNKTVYAGWEPTDVPNWLNGDDHFSYIIGREDGLIHPDSNITRAEVATIFFRLLQEDVRDQYLTESNSFTDVSADAWYNTAISTMASMGIVEGDLSGTFRPDDNITRAEFAAIAARFSNGSYDGADIFNDIADHWAREEINLVASTGWLNGYTSGSFNPNREITRAESMTIVNRMLKRLPENTSDLLEGMIEWPDNQSESAWYYLAVQEATNSHDFERKDDGVHESWTELTENTDWEQYQ